MTPPRLCCLALAFLSFRPVAQAADSDLRGIWSQTPSRPAIRANAPLGARLDSVMRAHRASEIELKRVQWHFFLLGEIRRRETLFILDTGAAGLSIDAELAGGLGLPVEIIQGRNFTRSSVTFGGEVFGPAPLRWTMRPVGTRRAGLYGLTPAPGLLGLVPLRQLGAVFDLGRSKLWLSPRAPTALGEALAADEWGRSFTALPLLSSTNRLRWFVPVVINDVRGFMLLDTGLVSTTLLRSAADRAAVAYRQEVEPQQRRVDAQGNVIEAHRGVARSFLLGGTRVPRALLEVAELPGVLATLQDGTPPAWGVAFGLLGNDTLEQLEAVLDCGGERLFLRRR